MFCVSHPQPQSEQLRSLYRSGWLHLGRSCRTAFKILTSKPAGTRSNEVLGVDEKQYLEWSIKKQVSERGIGLIWLRIRIIGVFFWTSGLHKSWSLSVSRLYSVCIFFGLCQIQRTFNLDFSGLPLPLLFVSSYFEREGNGLHNKQLTSLVMRSLNHAITQYSQKTW